MTTKRPTSYLTKRGVTKKQIENFGLGYFSEEEWPPYPKDLDDPDVAKYWDWSSKGSRLKDKLIFPLTDPMGTLMGIEIRTPSDEKKDYFKFYIDKAEAYPIFFGVDLAIESIWEKQSVFLVEGLFDIFPLQRLYPNVICTGTAGVSPNQMTFLQRYVKTVNVAFDQDEYGDQFFNKFFRDHRNDFDVINRIQYMGNDLSESWSRLGEDRFVNQFDKNLYLNSYI